MMKLVRADNGQDFEITTGYSVFVAVDGVVELPDELAQKLMAGGEYVALDSPAPVMPPPPVEDDEELDEEID